MFGWVGLNTRMLGWVGLDSRMFGWVGLNTRMFGWVGLDTRMFGWVGLNIECLDGLDWILECLDGLDWILEWLNGMVLNISKLPPITPRRNQTDIILTADIKSANPQIYNNSVSANLPNHIQIIASSNLGNRGSLSPQIYMLG